MPINKDEWKVDVRLSLEYFASRLEIIVIKLREDPKEEILDELERVVKEIIKTSKYLSEL